MSEANTETVVETTIEATFTKAQVETMIADATQKANGEAATFRHELSEIKQRDETDKVKNSEDLTELRGILGEKETLLTDQTTQIDGMKDQLDAYQKRDEEEFKSILAKVPEALRADVSDESLPLSTRLSLARKLAGQKTDPAGYRPPGEGGDNSITRQAFDALSPVDKSKHVSGGGTIHD